MPEPTTRTSFPERIELPIASPRRVLAAGGDLKSTLCRLDDREAALSASFGDLADAANLRAFYAALDEELTRAKPDVLVHDLHPTYHSTTVARRLAEAAGVPCERVQHHHAHVCACLAEHGIAASAIGIACDGTGFGTDGAIWGGEILHVHPSGFERCAALASFPLPGGDAAARQTWRPAWSLLCQACDGRVPSDLERLFDRVPQKERRTVTAMIAAGVNAPPTSSLGRVFDAVSFLTGLCDANTFEGEAAIRLQEAAEGHAAEVYPWEPVEEAGTVRLGLGPMIRSICRDVLEKRPASAIAAAFHATVGQMLSDTAAAMAARRGVRTVALTGGCFLNTILAGHVERTLRDREVQHVLRHQRLSPGDAALSVGQAFAVAARPSED
jgi:hydrogenase maturation protein HypF